MDLSQPFRGSAAVRSGAVTWRVLAGPRFRRIFPDVYVPIALVVDLVVRSMAAAVLTEPDGVVSGWSAAELLDASCGPAEAPAEVTMPNGHFRHPLPGLLVHRDRLAADEITMVAGTAVTTPLRTAFDLVRWRDRTEGVVAVDALARRHELALEELVALRHRYLGARGVRKVAPAVRLADPLAESPMESRIRVALVVGGLPAPVTQYPVVVSGRSFRLDLAYPSVRLGVEYDGRLHRSQERAMRDLEREALLAADGWKILRFQAATVLNAPRAVAAATRHELRIRGLVTR